MNPTVGYFITMNPGYAGRAELPENLKVSLRSVLVSPATQVLFRPCAMCVPDLRLISEIMLIAEGFLEASSLSRKFITLYKLCKELLSKQDHYDWGLRAIKSVLVVAGMLKRGDRERPEDQVLMRALRFPPNTPLPMLMQLFSETSMCQRLWRTTLRCSLASSQTCSQTWTFHGKETRSLKRL